MLVRKLERALRRILDRDELRHVRTGWVVAQPGDVSVVVLDVLQVPVIANAETTVVIERAVFAVEVEGVIDVVRDQGAVITLERAQASVAIVDEAHTAAFAADDHELSALPGNDPRGVVVRPARAKHARPER